MLDGLWNLHQNSFFLVFFFWGFYHPSTCGMKALSCCEAKWDLSCEQWALIEPWAKQTVKRVGWGHVWQARPLLRLVIYAHLYPSSDVRRGGNGLNGYRWWGWGENDQISHLPLQNKCDTPVLNRDRMQEWRKTVFEWSESICSQSVRSRGIRGRHGVARKPPEQPPVILPEGHHYHACMSTHTYLLERKNPKTLSA